MGRKSMSSRARQNAHNDDIPRAGDFGLLETVRQRAQKCLKHAISIAVKLSEDTEVSELSVIKEEIVSRWSDYSNAFEEHEVALVGAGDRNEIDQLTADYMTLNASYLEAKTRIYALISQFQDETPPTPQAGVSTSQQYTPSMKLAPIRITPFTGNPEEWMEFKATCDAVLIDSLPDIQRLQHLKDALVGEPRQLVSQVLPFDGAYAKAMKLLRDVYESTRAIVDGQLRKLYALPTIEMPTAQAFRDMSNTINGLIAMLNSCGIDTTTWDAILVFHVTQKFDSVTLSLWEEKLNGTRNVPTLKTLITFLQTRTTVLCRTELATYTHSQPNDRLTKNAFKPHFQSQPKQSSDFKRNADKHKVLYTLKPDYKCELCKENHLSSRCTELKTLPSIRDRYALLNKHGHCVNCFYPHSVDKCPFESACKKCSESHHTLLHMDNKRMLLNMTDPLASNECTTDDSNENDESDTLSMMSAEHFYHVNNEIDDDTLLATALVPTKSNGRSILLKALVDQGSTANVITLNACQTLRLKYVRLKIPMLGLGNAPVGNVIGRTRFEIGSIHDESYSLHINAIVVKTIADSKGFDKAHIKAWSHLKGLSLADPQYHKISTVDLLLGGSAHADFISGEVLKGERHQPIAQNSKLGWIVSGNTNLPQQTMAICRHLTFENAVHQTDDIAQLLTLFWEIEEPNVSRIFTAEEQLAEDIFKRSITRAEDGKFIVDLPFKLNPCESLGNSLSLAKQRYKWLQHKFDKKPELKMKYDAILEEYLSLGHMELVTDVPKFQYFLPHHHVEKQSSTTTKVRVVFDGSAKTSTGLSLNNCLCVGPVVQPELFELLVNWRKYEFAISADVEKMYRMLYVNKAHTDFLSILWHRPGTPGIASYRLLTVTFGTNCAPFQATRGLYEIGERIKSQNSLLANTIQTSFYVDDFLQSFSSISEAQQMQIELTETLSAYGFNLRKWKSNCATILEKIADEDRDSCVDFDSIFKTLGISWQSESDAFIFKCFNFKDTHIWTKRKVLSAIAKLFDPLGWLAPYVVRAKILMQNIWRDPNGIEWDSPLPQHLINEWKPIRSDLNKPIEIKIPRWIGLSVQHKQVEIHAFCDASNTAYACCVYVRIIQNEHVSCNLLAAKTKVAPLRAITIPRLELCGAVLLSKLTTRCIKALAIDDFKLFTWCDSKIVLAWLATHPNKWVPFVANRVSEVQQNIASSCWNHIRSKQNPADLASRGCSMSEISTNKLWWHGPEFLADSLKPIPNQNIVLPIENAPEKRKVIKVFHTNTIKENYVLNQFEDYHRLLHFTALAVRWLNRTRKQQTIHGPVVAQEIHNAESTWIKLIQREHFSHGIARILKNRPLPNMSSLLKLNPFVDETGFLRMNGRVNNIDNTQQKTSIILPAKSKLVLLVIRDAHQKQTLHGGVQITLRALRERFWIIHARNQVNKLTGHCMVCYRNKKLLVKQQMAELPLFRTQQCRPFTFVGCDYAGPFKIKTSKLRNAPVEKGYIALFICLTTKAIHLELVMNESMEEFVLALQNFIASRGIPTEMHTDNAGNFVGAEKEIHKLHEEWLAQPNSLSRFLAEKRITFKRIPARASHMAGIWERAVGLVKYHLKRVMKDTKLIAHKFHHVLKQIECALNSRPLWAITPNADDIEVITPSHFYNFQPINSLPRPDLSHLKINQLDQYQSLYRLYCDFWNGWSKEYLDQLQPRKKWPNKHPNIEVGQIVVVSDDNLPPSRWPLGRITAVYPAKDGLVRVVDVKVKDNILSRPIHRLGVIPIIDNKLNNSKNE